jgi:Putative mono-oxygenase ydhR
VPGLISKVWLANPATNTYGGVYTWRDRASMEAFARSELFQGIGRHPGLAAVSSKDFRVLEAPTRVTADTLPRMAGEHRLRYMPFLW